jgi:hypothetical protein
MALCHHTKRTAGGCRLLSGERKVNVCILESIQYAREQYAEIDFVYAWPFRTDEVARFLAAQIDRFL